ncbi:hypothetical protein KNV00_gp135 [Streptomyces phage Bmoc]|uniref:Uncharacterized protein n=1 Tax=Streptomyces phage Bmoc TaxID=2725629 RepID=A0A6M3TAS2_9CAUD|nr:hypothetical protein KNV00_gp135 [Streptomyces phage Bmoc]QJD50884.1 hypothetical protein SEA_BMOC_156 [Streptomyces phage Bmoc]
MIKFVSGLKPGDVTGFGTVVASQRGLDGRTYTLVLSEGREVQLNRFRLVRTRREF